MGLRTTHNCWDGPCTLFNDFRYALGRQIGINLSDYEGYRGGGMKPLESIEHDLMPLFNHSDCDGVLTVKESAQIAKGLDSVLNNFNDEVETYYDFKEHVIQFRDGCLDAVSKKQKIKFQ